MSSSRVSTPSEPPSALHSPLPRPSQRLVDIREEKPPISPRPDRQRGPEPEGLRIAEFLSNRPTSPFLASSQPKSDSRRVGPNTSNSDKTDTPRKHRRTSSHDLNAQHSKDGETKLKVRGSPQLLRRTQGEVEQEKNGSRNNSPSRKGRKKVSEGGGTVEVTPPTPTAEESVTSVTSDSMTGTSLDSFYQVPLLNSSSPPQLIAQAMASTE